MMILYETAQCCTQNILSLLIMYCYIVSIQKNDLKMFRTFLIIKLHACTHLICKRFIKQILNSTLMGA